MIPVDEIRLKVRGHYKDALAAGTCGCGDCCAPSTSPDALEDFIGPALGCGSPVTHAELRPGEVVVDLGSGAGGDVLRAARDVGSTGRAIGVDMTPEMVAAARGNAARVELDNTEFRLGEIEHLPLPDATADVVISNCVINLVPDKRRAFAEAFRVLRPGGRLVVSDVVANGTLPEAIRRSADAWAACVAGAVALEDYTAAMRAAGFTDITVLTASDAPRGTVYSATVRATKPLI